MKYRIAITIICFLSVIVLVGASEPIYLARGQIGEPRFAYPGARRFGINSYFDHHAPDYSIDQNLTIYTTEIGLASNGSHCYDSNGITVCGYYTEPNNGGRLIYYDGHPGIDYAFPNTTPVVAAALGTAYQRLVGQAQSVVIDHGGNYWTKYLHVDGASRIADGTPVQRGQQIALSDTSGTAQAHLHFEGRYTGENGILFDPYGWEGPWYTDPWNNPFRHTEDWWDSNDPIPMGYRDQNQVTHGPFQISGAIATKWDALDGDPGSPVSTQTSGSCPGAPYGDCQFFEKGYIRWDYSTATYYNYAASVVNQIFYISAANWNTTLSIRNISGASAQVSVIYVQNGHVTDSRTYLSLGAGSTWVLSSQQALQDMATCFTGEADVYSNQTVQVTVTYQPAINNVFLPAILNNY